MKRTRTKRTRTYLVPRTCEASTPPEEGYLQTACHRFIICQRCGQCLRHCTCTGTQPGIANMEQAGTPPATPKVDEAGTPPAMVILAEAASQLQLCAETELPIAAEHSAELGLITAPDAA